MATQLIMGIDLQEGFLTDETRSNDYVKRVSEYLAAQPKEQVILTKFINRPHNNFERLIQYTDLQSDDLNSHLIGNLENSGYEIIEKATYTAWVPEVIERAGQQGATEIVMFGLDTHACVLKTALDVFEAGLVPVVITELCASSKGSEYHEAGLQLLQTMIGNEQLR
jgi:nicotinamidase-related amidase